MRAQVGAPLTDGSKSDEGKSQGIVTLRVACTSLRAASMSLQGSLLNYRVGWKGSHSESEIEVTGERTIS